MITFLILAIIVGTSLVLIEEGLRKAPEGVEDEHGFHVIGESARTEQTAEERSDQGSDAPLHASFLSAAHLK